MTLETLPAPLQKCVETVREQFVARHLNISSAVIEECALGILNVALEAGVAREGAATNWDMPQMYVQAGKPIYDFQWPVLVFQTGEPSCIPTGDT